MSITFSIQGHEPHDYEARFGEPGGWWINLANENARNLLDWLGYGDVDLWTSDGLLYAPHVATQCRERLRLTPGNVDAGREPHTYQAPSGCRVIVGGRAEGYLMDRVEQLLRLAEHAGSGFITFG